MDIKDKGNVPLSYIFEKPMISMNIKKSRCRTKITSFATTFFIIGILI